MKLLPRYTFRAGELCPHNDPDCLCDVHIDKPTPIVTNIPHLFHNMALEELDDHGVNSRNVVEFFSIVLGLHDVYRREIRDPNEDENWLRSNCPLEGKSDTGPQAWRDLPTEIKVVLRRHYNAGTPWSYAMIELEDLVLSESDVKQIARYYKDNRGAVFYADRRRVTLQVRDCGVCGAAFVARQYNSMFCTTKCRVKHHRILKKQEAQV